jgi:DNA-directed RNA polymerase I subunit RPA2
MGKQTMGTPVHSWVHRTDTKLFRLQNPQAPLVQAEAQAEYGFDDYPSGANAIVAVIAYTGFDMEDACIVNKCSYERGFGHASVYKTHVIDLMADKPASDVGRFVFHNAYVKGESAFRAPAPAGAAAAVPPPRPRPGERIFDGLDEDGLPPVGKRIVEGDPLYAFLDTVTSTHRVARHKDAEPCVIDEVRVLPPATGTSGAAAAAAAGVCRVSIKVRYNRNPVVGDKFSSRHGQKGVLSFLWPQEDMPFTDAGMTPDVIINPHAFPSRMTIGMLVESLAGKAGACHGTFQDATPFQFNEQQRAGDYFGQQLVAAGYSFAGTETMYSGVTGEPLHADIYLGVVYYQRLRHMVSDKSQVRATGPINNLTRQPVKGRKKHGGIRFGEMERDSLLAHGASFLLHDRLMNSSDRHIALVCRGCGSMLAPISVPAVATLVELQRGGGECEAAGAGTRGSGSAAASMLTAAAAAASTSTTSNMNIGAGPEAAARVQRARRQPTCRLCGTGKHVAAVAVPYVFRYLLNELAGMNIKVKLELGEGPYAHE